MTNNKHIKIIAVVASVAVLILLLPLLILFFAGVVVSVLFFKLFQKSAKFINGYEEKNQVLIIERADLENFAWQFEESFKKLLNIKCDYFNPNYKHRLGGAIKKILKDENLSKPHFTLKK